jgi:hypothetical protein
VHRWVESNQNFDRDYNGSCDYFELPGSSDLGDQAPSTYRPRTDEDEDEDEIGSFFKGWKEDQEERRQQTADLT